MLVKFTLVTILLVYGWAHGTEIIGSDLVDKAKAEGEVVWYSTLPLPETQAWAALFTKKYAIKVSLFRAGAVAKIKMDALITAGRKVNQRRLRALGLSMASPQRERNAVTNPCWCGASTASGASAIATARAMW